MHSAPPTPSNSRRNSDWVEDIGIDQFVQVDGTEDTTGDVGEPGDFNSNSSFVVCLLAKGFDLLVVVSWT